MNRVTVTKLVGFFVLILAGPGGLRAAAAGTGDGAGRAGAVGGSATPAQAGSNEVKAQLAHPTPTLQDRKGPQSEMITLTLEKSITLAIRQATAVQKAKGELDFNGDQLIQAYAEFLPNLTATGTYNKMTGSNYLTAAAPTAVTSVNSGASYQVSSTLNLFNGFADLAGWRASKARKDAAAMTFQRAKQEIALDVAQNFLQVVLDQELVRIAEKNLLSSQARERLLSEQTRVGVRNLADLYRQQAETSSDEAFLVTSQAKQRTDALMLLRKLRLSAAQNFNVVGPKLEEYAAKVGATSEFDDEDKLVQTALDKRLDLKASERTFAAADWDITGARSPYYPRVDLGASISSAGRLLDRQWVDTFGSAATNMVPSQQDGLDTQLAHYVDTTVGITFTWTLFDRWQTQTHVERTQVDAHNAQLDQEDRRNQVIAEVRQAFGDYRTIQQQMDSTKKGLFAAQKAFEVVRGRYQVGSASFVDLTTAQAALVQAEAARAQAVIALALQTRALKTAMGTAAPEAEATTTE